MRHNEYERWRRLLEQQFDSDVELLRAGYQAKLRALEMLWLASPEEGQEALEHRSVRLLGETLPSETVPNSEMAQLSETLTGSETPAAKAPARTLRRGEILEEVTAALPELPEVFDRQDIWRVLGFAPSRATLHRVFNDLLRNHSIAVERFSDGHAPTRYRKVAPGA
jgi:hypothetical protein